MGIFSRIFKGIKKVVKKIGRGIKKVVKKVGRAVGKLGIVGQIGMMFLMPYAMGAMGGLFAKAGTWAAKLATSNVFGAKALGAVVNAVHTAGTFVGGKLAAIKNGLGDTISGAVDWIAKKTGTTDIVAGVRNIMNKGQNLFGTKDVGKTGGKYIPFEDLTEEGMSIIRNATSEQMDQILNVGLEEWVFAGDPSEWPAGSLFKSGAGDPSIFGTRSRVGTPPFRPEIRTATTTTSYGGDWDAYQQSRSLLGPTTAFAPEESTGFIDRIKDGVKDYVANFDVGAAIEQSVVRPALQGVGERVARKAAGDPGEQVVRHYTIPDLIRFSSDAGVFNEIDLAHQQNGNVFAAYNYANHDILKEYGGQDQLPGYRGIQLLAEQDSYAQVA